MGLDVWFSEDIARVLKAVAHANEMALEAGLVIEPDPYRAGYQAGHFAALAAVALAFGLPQVTDTQKAVLHG